MNGRKNGTVPKLSKCKASHQPDKPGMEIESLNYVVGKVWDDEIVSQKPTPRNQSEK